MAIDMKVRLLIGFILLVSLPNLVLAQDYPVPPKTQELLFYIQRNHNSNTIVYDAQFDKDGILDTEKPILAYWIRYDESGQKMALRKIEKLYAYGVECKPSKKNKGTYIVKLVADKKRLIILKQEAPFKAQVYTKIDNEISILDHLYIQADNSGIWPKVEYIELFGKQVKSSNKTHQKIEIDS
jgi:hypothetical protein